MVLNVLHIITSTPYQRISALPNRLVISNQQYVEGLDQYNYDAAQKRLIAPIQDLKPSETPANKFSLVGSN